MSGRRGQCQNQGEGQRGSQRLNPGSPPGPEPHLRWVTQPAEPHTKGCGVVMRSLAAQALLAGWAGPCHRPREACRVSSDAREGGTCPWPPSGRLLGSRVEAATS